MFTGKFNKNIEDIITLSELCAENLAKSKNGEADVLEKRLEDILDRVLLGMTAAEANSAFYDVRTIYQLSRAGGEDFPLLADLKSPDEKIEETPCKYRKAMVYGKSEVAEKNTSIKIGKKTPKPEELAPQNLEYRERLFASGGFDIDEYHLHIPFELRDEIGKILRFGENYY